MTDWLKGVVLFGNRELAELALWYLANDSPYRVTHVTMHEAYMPDEPEWNGRPVVPFEELETHCPPDDYLLFAPLSEHRMMDLRIQVYQEGKERGYHFISYVSSRANVFSMVGDNCFILEDNTIQPFVEIGDNITMWSGNHIGHHGHIGDHCYFTSHVVLSGRCTVEKRCYFGVNSTIRDGTFLARGTLVGMGATVTKDILKEWGAYVGTPARRIEGDTRELL